jgi:hypothetical protein
MKLWRPSQTNISGQISHSQVSRCYPCQDLVKLFLKRVMKMREHRSLTIQFGHPARRCDGLYRFV